MPYVYVNPPLAGGQSGSADKLSIPRLIELDGDVTGQAYFDGSQDVLIRTKIKTTEGGGTITGDDIGFGLTIKEGRVVVDTPVLAGKDMGVDEDGRLITEAVDVNLLYVPADTELVVGGN